MSIGRSPLATANMADDLRKDKKHTGIMEKEKKEKEKENEKGKKENVKEKKKVKRKGARTKSRKNEI